MTRELSRRRQWVLQSEIRNMSIECDKIGGINLSQGVCDMELPAAIRKAAQEAIEKGYNSYTRYDGISELREAIAIKQERFTGLKYDADTEIVVSSGSTGALYCACLALLNPQDEVIVFEPYYGYHVSTLIATQATPVYVKTIPPDWTFTCDDLEKARTSRTKGIIVNTPSNPSGKVFTYNELSIIADFADKYDLFVFTDEIYEHFVYDGAKHIAPATLAGMYEKTITISGVSKCFSITGWRIGYCLCDKKWAQTIGYFNDLVYVCAPAPLQKGVAEGLSILDDSYYLNMSVQYEKKRDALCSALKDAGLEPSIPGGAYYVLADISPLPGNTSKEKVMYLLDKTKVASVPGEAFYHDETGRNLARFCFAKEDNVIDNACRMLKAL